MKTQERVDVALYRVQGDRIAIEVRMNAVVAVLEFPEDFGEGTVADVDFVAANLPMLLEKAFHEHSDDWHMEERAV